jgi:nucleotide-binding universal stress UspA family protein
MFGSILCPVDFSGESLAALRYAATLAGRSGARVAALHVADPFLVQAATAALQKPLVVRESERALEEAVRQIRRDIGADAPAFDVHVATGDPAVEICRYARRHESDLVVMTSHQLRGVQRLLFGSVPESVLRSASAPVLVFPAHNLRRSPAHLMLALEPVAATNR